MSHAFVELVGAIPDVAVEARRDGVVQHRWEAGEKVIVMLGARELWLARYTDPDRVIRTLGADAGPMVKDVYKRVGMVGDVLVFEFDRTEEP